MAAIFEPFDPRQECYGGPVELGRFNRHLWSCTIGGRNGELWISPFEQCVYTFLTTAGTIVKGGIFSMPGTYTKSFLVDIDGFAIEILNPMTGKTQKKIKTCQKRLDLGKAS